MSATAVERGELETLRSTQIALTEALIATQDRLLAVEALARVNGRGAGDQTTLDDLLDRALTLTGASQVLLVEAGRVTATRGEATAPQSHLDAEGLVPGPAGGVVLLSTPSGSTLVGTLDPDADTRRQVAFVRPPGHPFTTADVPLVEAITSALSVRLTLDELHRRELEQAVIEREHQLASALAQSVIADEPPASRTVSIFARTAPACLTGGDFYVFGRGEGMIWFAVGDVAGKGLPAAMLMTRAVTACRLAFMAHGSGTLPQVFQHLEDELFDHLDDAGLFTTLAVGSIDESTGLVQMVNAGHSPVALVRDGSAAPVAPSVPPLGIVRGRVPTVCAVALTPSDRLVIGTDGLVDQTDPVGELFGYERFHEVCRLNHDRPPAHLGDGVFETVSGFAAGTAASDDATLVVIGYGGEAS